MEEISARRSRHLHPAEEPESLLVGVGRESVNVERAEAAVDLGHGVEV